MELSPTPILLVCATVTIVLLLGQLMGAHGRKRSAKKRAGGGKLPPGPPALLFVAKFLALRRSIFDLGPLLRDLHARHGPVISVRLFRTMVFVADRHLAHRALVQGGAIFADRPPPIEPGIMFTAGGRDISGSSYGAYWRLVRRNLAGDALHPSRVAQFAPARRRVCDTLVGNLLRLGAVTKEVTLRPLLRRAMFELLVHMCFGAWLEQQELEEIERLQHQSLRSVTSFPVFGFFPTVTKRIFRKRWAELVAVRRRQDEIFLPLIHHHNKAGQDQQAPRPPCYADSLLALRVPDEGDRPLTDTEMVSLCSEFLNGGTDTTVTLVEWIMAELVNHQDIQAKLRQQLQAQSGGGDSDIQAKMPLSSYLKAVVLEGLRLHPPGHFVLPHGVQTDSEIGGYKVPKGAEVNFLVAEMGRDEEVWKAPLEFRPERFLDGGEGCGVDITGSREIRMMPFGAGRRMCPGYALGTHHAEYFVARMVRDLEWHPSSSAAVDMEEALDFTTVIKHPLRARIVAVVPAHK